MGKKYRAMSFYEFMEQYPYKDQKRKELAALIIRLGKKHPQLKKIDSLTDLILCGPLLISDQDANFLPFIWCEYCSATGHQLAESED